MTDDQTDATKPLAEFNDLAGTLTIGERELLITSTIRVDQNGRITITTAPFDLTSDNFWIFQEVPGRERLAKWARLRAAAATGEHVESDYVVMTGRTDHSGPDGTTITLRGELRRLSVHYNPAPT
ncbi:MAG TPA: hypothetical protein VF219_01865, partial [Vicinamibacterales bacterium]